MKDVQCYELFGGIALKNHAFSLFFFLNYCGRQLTKGWLGLRCLPSLKRKVQPLVLEHASIACNMMGGLIGAFDSRFGCGI